MLELPKKKKSRDTTPCSFSHTEREHTTRSYTGTKRIVMATEMATASLESNAHHLL